MIYTRFHSLAELESHAYATNDRATLDLIELAEDAAGIEAERVRERRAEVLAAARGVLETVRERDELRERLAQCHRQIAQARELEFAIRFVLRPFLGKLAPKWAQHLRSVLQRIAIEQSK